MKTLVVLTKKKAEKRVEDDLLSEDRRSIDTFDTQYHLRFRNRYDLGKWSENVLPAYALANP